MALPRHLSLSLFLTLVLCACVLVHGGGEPDEEEANELAPSPSSETPCSSHTHGSSQEALAWRLAGMFGILVASSIGFLVPFFFRHPKHRVWLFFFRAFAAGVVLATGMVHVLPEATETLEDPCLGLPENFPWTPVFATFAALLAFTVEYFIREALISSSKEASALLSSVDAVKGGSVECTEGCTECKECVECEECVQGCAECPEECQDCQTGVPVCTDCDLETGAEGNASLKEASSEFPQAESVESPTHKPLDPKPQGPVAKTKSKAEIQAAPSVTCVSPTIKGAGHVPKGAEGCHGGEDDIEAIMGYRAAALTLEAGIVFHSIFIGIALGTSQDVEFVQGLAIALCFHQGFEGISLGSSLVKARLSMVKVIILGIVFVLTTPLGVAIGLALGSAYNPDSPAALAVDGAFGAASAGILIYAGLVDLVHPTFEKSDPSTPKNKIALGFGFFSMFLGAGFMSVIALWA